jgi:DNA-binding response OmpR family regulator
MKLPLVLIVEADSNVRHVLVDVLRSAGYRTLEAADEETARGVLGCVVPDVVLVDHASGDASARLLRLISWVRDARSSYAGTLHVVGMAGSEPEAEALLAAGATRLLRKPFGPRALTEAIAQVLARCEVRPDPGEVS